MKRRSSIDFEDKIPGHDWKKNMKRAECDVTKREQQRERWKRNRSYGDGDTVIEAKEGIVKGNAIILKDTCVTVRQFSPWILEKGNFLHHRFS